MRVISRFLVMALLMGGMFALAPDASAAAGQLITVNTPKDLVNGSDGRCSLREAVTAAADDAASGDAGNECAAGSAAGQDVIQLKPETTYSLTRDGDGDENANADGDLDILSGSSVKIRGGKRTRIAQTDTGQRVIDVRSLASLALERITITGGRSQPGIEGGGIRNYGTLALWKCKVSGNRTGTAPVGSRHRGGEGAGIYNGGTLLVEFSTVANNTAGDGANISMFSSMPTQGGSGGGIYNNGDAMTITDSKVLNNRAGRGGHGTSSSVAAAGVPGANGGDGGGIAAGNAIIRRSTIAGNRAGDGGDGGRGGQTVDGEGLDGQHGGSAGAGGGVFVTGTFEILDSTISRNRTAEGGNGGPGGFGSPTGGRGSDGTDGAGGGLTVIGNATLSNVTISGNTSHVGGGGILSVGDVRLNNVTIARNTVLAGDGGGVWRIGGARFSLKSTLIADNSAHQSRDCDGTFEANTFNLVEDPEGCTGLGSTDTIGVDPRLAALDANGGPTKTHALRRGSPAINAGSPEPSSSCMPNDQRGKPRDDCDVGAYERV